MKSIEIVTHFDKHDKDCSCDYYSVDVKLGDKIVRHYGDAYHEKGSIRAEAFIDGWLHAQGDDGHLNEAEHGSKLIKRTNRADGKT